jgi:predicted metal-binding protein
LMTARRTLGRPGPKGPQACYVYDAERHRRYIKRYRRGVLVATRIPAKSVLDPEARLFDSMSEAAAAYGWLLANADAVQAAAGVLAHGGGR